MSERVEIKLRNVRIMYPNLWMPRNPFPGQKAKFSATFVLTKDNAAEHQAIMEAQKHLLGTMKGNPKMPPYYEASEKYPDTEELAGCRILRASRNEDKGRVPTFSQTKDLMDEQGVMSIASGDWVHASVNMYTYNAPTGSGITFGLEGVMFARKGDPLGPRPDAKSAFDDVEAEDVYGEPPKPSGNGEASSQQYDW